MNLNDLIGLTYGWNHAPGDGSGKTDCFQLACEVRRRLDMSDYSERFAWVYTEFLDEQFNRAKIARWLLQCGNRLELPIPGAVRLLPVDEGAALATYLHDGTTIFLSPGGSVIRTQILDSLGYCFWMNP
jgi:hypothetical protein